MSKQLVVLDVHGSDVIGTPLVALGIWDGTGQPEMLDFMTVAPAEAAALRKLLAQTRTPQEVDAP